MNYSDRIAEIEAELSEVIADLKHKQRVNEELKAERDQLKAEVDEHRLMREHWHAEACGEFRLRQQLEAENARLKELGSKVYEIGKSDGLIEENRSDAELQRGPQGPQGPQGTPLNLGHLNKVALFIWSLWVRVCVIGWTILTLTVVAGVALIKLGVFKP